MDAAERAISAFRSRHGRDPAFVVAAPGRVNLIGEHLDYNGGHVLPMALPYSTAIAGEPTGDDSVEVESEGFGSSRFSLADRPDPSAGWTAYVHGTAWALQERAVPVRGWRGHIATDVPVGASLSSSAALEVASGLAFACTADRSVAPLDLARAGQRVENELLGLPSGIMDQLVSAAAIDGHALLIDCASLDTEPIPVPADATVVVMDTGTRRRLVDSEFASRRADCVQAAASLGVTHLVDADIASVKRLAGTLGRRARHVVTEERRTVEAALLLAERDIEAVGQLMAESHRSLRDDYEVSAPALDAIVEIALASSGCVGARMTGGGFAGCAVALVRSDDVAAFCLEVHSGFGPGATLYPVRPAAGARRLA